MIYELVLELNVVIREKSLICYTNLTPRSQALNMQKPYKLALAGACKQIKRETLPMLYGTNTFFFACLEWVEDFFGLIGQDNCQWIRILSISFLGERINKALKMLATLNNLEKLRIEFSESTYFGNRHPRGDLSKVNGMKLLRKVRGCKEVIIDYRLADGGDLKRYAEAVESKENMAKFEATLKEELCRERLPEKKKGKRALATAKNIKHLFTQARNLRS